MGTGPTLHATTSSSTTPTPPLHPFIFHMFPWELLSPFIITSETLATSSLTACQRLFLPVKFWDITLIRLLFPLDNQQTNNCFYVLHSQANLILWHTNSFSNMVKFEIIYLYAQWTTCFPHNLQNFSQTVALLCWINTEGSDKKNTDFFSWRSTNVHWIKTSEPRKSGLWKQKCSW